MNVTFDLFVHSIITVYKFNDILGELSNQCNNNNNLPITNRDVEGSYKVFPFIANQCVLTKNAYLLIQKE